MLTGRQSPRALPDGCSSGTHCFEREKPQHREPWGIQDEVRGAQGRTADRTNPSHFATCGKDCPVEQVTGTIAGSSAEGGWGLPTESSGSMRRARAVVRLYTGSLSIQVTTRPELDRSRGTGAIAGELSRCQDCFGWSKKTVSFRTCGPSVAASSQSWGLYDMREMSGVDRGSVKRQL